MTTIAEIMKAKLGAQIVEVEKVLEQIVVQPDEGYMRRQQAGFEHAKRMRIIQRNTRNKREGRVAKARPIR